MNENNTLKIKEVLVFKKENDEKKLIEKIDKKIFEFNLHNITETTYDKTAQKWALVIANQGKGVEKHQLRNFYDKVLELYEKAQNKDDKEFRQEILPFIRMLRSKVYYAKNKQNSPVNDAFVEFFNYALDQIDNKKSFENFKYLLEAIVGFYQKNKYEIHIINPNQNNSQNNSRNARRR
jgi:CRISPR-associated protein Csm2